MKIKSNKIIEATEAELMEHYLKEGYDDIYSFREYLRLMVEAGVKILEEENKGYENSRRKGGKVCNGIR